MSRTWNERAARGAGLSTLPVLLPVGLAAAITFANTIANEPVYDDRWTLGRLDMTHTDLWDLMWRRRGLTRVFHHLDQRFWDGSFPGMHVTNIVLHTLVSLLVVLFTLRLVNSRRVSLLCGLLFAVHPIHVEVVASITNRNDMLAAVFVFVALLLWLRHDSWLSYVGALIALVLGLFAKEVTAVAVLPMLLLLDLLPGARPGPSPGMRRRSAAVRFAPMALVGLAAGWSFAGDVSRRFADSAIRLLFDSRVETYPQVLAAALTAVPQNLTLLFAPWTLSIDYPIPDVAGGLASVGSLVGGAIVLAWIAATIYLWGRDPMTGFAMAWVLLTFLPCSNVVPLTPFFVAERYHYVPSFGACLLLALAFDRALALGVRRRPVAVGTVTVVVLLVGGFFYRSISRNLDWKNSHTIWSATIRDGFHTAEAHNNLGVARYERREYTEAVREFRRAARIDPDWARGSAELHNNLGVALFKGLEYTEAIGEFKLALSIDPRWTSAVVNLGNTYLAQGAYGAAERAYRRALEINPAEIGALHGLGVALGRQGRLEEGVDAERRALRIEPGHADAHYWLGILLSQMGRSHEALPHLSRAVDLIPDDANHRKTLGKLLMQLGRTEEATVQFAEARRLQPD